MKIRVFLGENEQKLYKKIGANPEVVLTWLNREVIKILEKSENIYGTLNNLDEDKVLEVLKEAVKQKKKERLEYMEINKHWKSQEEKKRECLGKTRRENER